MVDALLCTLSSGCRRFSHEGPFFERTFLMRTFLRSKIWRTIFPEDQIRKHFLMDIRVCILIFHRELTRPHISFAKNESKNIFEINFSDPALDTHDSSNDCDFVSAV